MDKKPAKYKYSKQCCTINFKKPPSEKLEPQQKREFGISKVHAAVQRKLGKTGAINSRKKIGVDPFHLHKIAKKINELSSFFYFGLSLPESSLNTAAADDA